MIIEFFEHDGLKYELRRLVNASVVAVAVFLEGKRVCPTFWVTKETADDMAKIGLNAMESLSAGAKDCIVKDRAAEIADAFNEIEVEASHEASHE